MSQSDELIHIATLKKPYGIQGWLWVFSELEDRSSIFGLKNWQMKTATGYKPLTVKKWRVQGSGLVASFNEVTDRNLAETMNGTRIFVTKDSLPKLSEHEYYWSDLVGLTVINEQKQCFGVVKSLFETGANDVMVVAPTSESIDNEERLIPWHTSTVLIVDLENKMITVAWGVDY